MCREKSFDLFKWGRKSSRFVAILIATVLVFSVFALSGCGAQKEEKDADKEAMATAIPQRLIDPASEIDPEEGKLFVQGLAPAQEGDKWGYINEQGEMVIEPQFDYAYSFTGTGLAVVANHKNGRYRPFCINKQGEVVIGPKFDWICDYYLGGEYLLIEQKGKEGIIDLEGNVVVEPKFDIVEAVDPTDIRFDRVFVYDEKKEKYGLVDFEGNVIVEPKYESVGSFALNGLACVEEQNEDGEMLYGYIDINGKEVIDVQFEYADDFADNGLAVVENADEKRGYINSKGEYVIEPQFDWADTFGSSDTAVVQVESFCGIIDSRGSYVIEPVYEELGNFAKNGLAATTTIESFGYINRDGNYAFDTISLIGSSTYTGGDSFEDNGLAKIYRFSRVGYIDSKGKIIIPHEYDNIGPFVDGKVWAWAWTADKGDELIQYNLEGEVVQKKRYVPLMLDCTSDGYVLFYNNDKTVSILDGEGKLVGTFDGVRDRSKNDLCKEKGCLEYTEHYGKKYCYMHKKKKIRIMK